MLQRHDLSTRCKVGVNRLSRPGDEDKVGGFGNGAGGVRGEEEDGGCELEG